jgi:hypothetical protein
MNVECTTNGSFSGELYHPNELSDAQGLPRTLFPVFERSKNTISSLSLLQPGESGSRALPEIDSEGVGASRLSARLDLQLRQGKTGTPKNLHSLYGEDSAAHLQPGGNPALYYWWTLPRHTQRNRRLNEDVSESYGLLLKSTYECFDQAQHERKNSHDFRLSSVRPEGLEG